MPDPYWDDVAKKAAEDRAKGKIKEVAFPPRFGSRTGICVTCGENKDNDGWCRCFQSFSRSVNGPRG